MSVAQISQQHKLQRCRTLGLPELKLISELYRLLPDTLQYLFIHTMAIQGGWACKSSIIGITMLRFHFTLWYRMIHA